MQTDCSLEYEDDAQNNYQILTQTLLFSTSTWSDSLLMAVPGNLTPKDGGGGSSIFLVEQHEISNIYKFFSIYYWLGGNGYICFVKLEHELNNP